MAKMTKAKKTAKVTASAKKPVGKKAKASAQNNAQEEKALAKGAKASAEAPSKKALAKASEKASERALGKLQAKANGKNAPKMGKKVGRKPGKKGAEKAVSSMATDNDVERSVEKTLEMIAEKAANRAKAKAAGRAFMKKGKLVSITEAARINNVTRQAIYVAIKQKKLKAFKDATRWTINIDDLEAYRRDKYSRAKSMFNGELLFDNRKGFFSVNQVAKILKVPAQKIYYATRVGQLKASRKGAAWIIHIDDIKFYQDNHLNKLESNFAAG